jgi:hypothetical protein
VGVNFCTTARNMVVKDEVKQEAAPEVKVEAAPLMKMEVK